jgi:hypothetical protein
MKKKTGFFILVLGLAVIAAAILGVPDQFAFNADDLTNILQWEGRRQALAGAGVLLTLWGVYAATRKDKKKK